MQDLRSKITFSVSAVLYVVFNTRIGGSAIETLKETLWQIVQTAPFVAGITYFIVALLQYMAGGDKVPWDRRLRLFFAIGIIAGLIYGIYEYAGVDLTGR
ncbi:hypothetical protein [Desulforhopalus singaporensis]|uniref:Uncharacterized protein n=1 Tax=Desulforhopalus singaporensis TaxID=91360 RepID=A0A1H0TMT4_9BACT|nr:hypothetical protein [Desulforhopalus singaporensis]SDP54856.1 hypothetical protein SAMN05660330_03143 [Desulforhopalus singaporensis]